jgi:thioredoxin 1
MSKFNDLINSGKTVLVDFSAEWCGPCKMMAPVLKELASITSDDVKIIKVDVDKNQEAAMAFNVQSVPTLIVFKDGAVKWRQSGVVPAQQLKIILERVTQTPHTPNDGGS